MAAAQVVAIPKTEWPAAIKQASMFMATSNSSSTMRTFTGNLARSDLIAFAALRFMD
jgi:hypothetical protein